MSHTLLKSELELDIEKRVVRSLNALLSERYHYINKVKNDSLADGLLYFFFALPTTCAIFDLNAYKFVEYFARSTGSDLSMMPEIYIK